jgi:nucleoid-associated protein EbfC
MDSTPEVEAMMERLRGQQEELERIRRDVDSMVVKGRSRANEVEASVQGTGRFTAIMIDPAAIRRYDPHDLGKASQTKFATALA